MRFPFFTKSKTEKRSGYSQLLLGQFEAAVSGDGTGKGSLSTAAVEASVGLYARAMAVAVVNGPGELVSAVTPSVLATTARSMLRAGESFWRIDLRKGRVRLAPAGYAYPYGQESDPMSWEYQLTTYGPSGSVAGWYPASQVVHCRYAIDPVRPWVGVPPWSWSGASASALGSIEAVLKDQASAPHGNLLGVPEQPEIDDETHPLDMFRTDLAKAKGRTLVMENTGKWDGSGSTGSRAEQLSFGLGFSDASSSMSDHAMQIAAAFGVPPALINAGSDGTAQRESLRRWMHTSLTPLASFIAEELSEKLEAKISLDLTGIHAADVAGRARAFKAFVDGGMTEESASRIVGLEHD